MAVIPIVPAADADTATQFFRNYTRMEPRAPLALWWVARAAVLAAALALALMLLVWPVLGLKLFWGLAVPLLPALLVIAPGLWRQVCPMATLNQLPRLLGRGLARELPPRAKAAAFGIAVALLVGAVALRRPWLDHDATAVGAGVLAVLALALAGGWVYKGRSGWCGTFCPLAPVQRSYGQAPLLLVRNGYCNPCVGCQKSCYDFNPRAAVFADLYDEDLRWSSQRRWFMGALPGLVLGHFLQPALGIGGLPAQVGFVLLCLCASAGLYALLLAFAALAAVNPYRVALAFGALALTAFYFFAGPIIVSTLVTLADPAASVPPAWRAVASTTGGVIALALLWSGLRAERLYRATQAAAQPAPVPAAVTEAPDPGRTQFGGARALKERLARAGAAAPEVTDRESGIRFALAPNQCLLQAIEGAGLKLAYGCRAGVCGADPVAVCEGAQHLAPPGADEWATLQRLGLAQGEPQAPTVRLACMGRARAGAAGPIVIDRDARAAPAVAAVAAAADVAPARDRAREAGIERVLIVGNGVAGTTAAEALRAASATVEIGIVANEPHPFYNRMGLGRLVHEDAGIEALQLVPPDWAQRRRVAFWPGRVAARIDRDKHRLGLDDGQWLRYDRLLLATGARATTPDDDFLKHRNAFVLRSAADALAIRQYARAHGARRALVLGGGVLGVEAAEALQQLGLKVTLLQRAERLMNAQLDAEGGAKLQAYLEQRGLQVACGMAVQRWDGADGKLAAAWLAHGPRVRADLFVACLGIQPNSYLAEQAGLPVQRGGIVVDAGMRTADPQILAIGDVADAPGGPQAPRGLWTVAAAQAQVAVRTLLGESPPAAGPPAPVVLQLKSDGIDLRSSGRIAAQAGEDSFHAAAGEAAWWRLVVREGSLVGGLWVGPPGSSAGFTRLLGAPPDLMPWRAELGAGRVEGLLAQVGAT